ncbi:ROK family transcriptional regulator [Clostridium sp. BJN0013]|uniref:ROK family transcriptional regulator n=1 Tax=Clostridium sp. BJN0013 TaxID=3236840 RepID=UPI0034C6A4C4
MYLIFKGMIIMVDNYKLFKDLNPDEKNIFNLIQKDGAMTKNEILLKTGMKLTSLNRIMGPLEEKRIIVQKCIGESTGGRKPILYDINLCRFYIVGIDISKTHAQVSIVNLRMEIFYKKSFYVNSSDSYNEVVEKIVRIISDAYVELNLEFIDLIGVGLGIETDIWNDVNIDEILEKKLECNVVSENGANSAVIAEYLYGSGKQFKNLAYFNCGLRIREGTILQDRIIKTADDNEYAFEHMVINTNQDVDFDKVCLSVQKNNELSEKIIFDVASKLGKSIEFYSDLLDLNCVILSGPLINSDLFYETCVRYVPEKVIFKRDGYFKEDAISIGAAALLLERCIDSKI